MVQLKDSPSLLHQEKSFFCSFSCSCLFSCSYQAAFTDVGSTCTHTQKHTHTHTHTHTERERERERDCYFVQCCCAVTHTITCCKRLHPRLPHRYRERSPKIRFEGKKGYRVCGWVMRFAQIKVVIYRYVVVVWVHFVSSMAAFSRKEFTTNLQEDDKRWHIQWIDTIKQSILWLVCPPDSTVKRKLTKKIKTKKSYRYSYRVCLFVCLFSALHSCGPTPQTPTLASRRLFWYFLQLLQSIGISLVFVLVLRA